jgi:pyruvate kinase
MDRKARIVATIGPSSDEDFILENMINAGMDVARLNFSHGSHLEHLDRIQKIRSISNKLSKQVAVLQDLQGPKMRVGELPDCGINLITGQEVQISNHPSLKDSRIPNIPVDVPGLNESLKPGSRILLDDGRIELRTKQINKKSITAEVIIGGKVTSHKGVNLPGAKLLFPSFTEKDEIDLEFGLKHDVDILAISFVQTADDIKRIREKVKALTPEKAQIPIIAKLERPDALQNLDEILSVSDGVMVARGDLGVETSPSAVPIMQKTIIDKANQVNKVVITATQMLESMITNTRPTRAEASDVANAIFDGTDAVMLSGETASGEFPVESLTMMDCIVKEAEAHFQEWGNIRKPTDRVIMDDASAITLATCELAQDRNVAAIAVFTLSGKTALLMSKTRPNVPILAFTPNESTLNWMNILWGVRPFLVTFASTVEGMISIVEKTILEHTKLKKGQQVVIVSGLPLSAMHTPNFALLHTIGEPYQ